MPEFYDGTKLLSLKDLNGNEPEIFICTSNRSAGKTTYFNRLLVNRFFNRKEKFCLLYRFAYELDHIADKFFKDIRNLFFPKFYMRAERKAKGIYYELYIFTAKEAELNPKNPGILCGYATALNYADQIKKFSHFFSDVCSILFDEFQSETNHYCDMEIEKFISIHTSLARGNGDQVRYLPTYMISNPVSLLNPYYVELNISERLKPNTRFLKGNGFVLEQNFNESASVSQLKSGFNSAFHKNSYVAYASQNIYLNDNTAFVEKPSGHSRYLGTLRYKNIDYAIREFDTLGIIYCDTNADSSFKNRVAVTLDDHTINYVMLKANQLFIDTLRYYFDRGCFRFKNLACKEAVLKSISYH